MPLPSSVRRRAREGSDRKPNREKPKTREVDEAERARTRRLFGALVGHLGSARKEEGEKLKKHDAELHPERPHPERKRSYDEYKAQRTQAELLASHYIRATAPVKRCCRTRTDPPLCWLPAIHNEHSQKILALSADAVTADLAAKDAALRLYLTQLDTRPCTDNASPQAKSDDDSDDYDDSRDRSLKRPRSSPCSSSSAMIKDQTLLLSA